MAFKKGSVDMKYVEPEIEIIKLEAKDVIKTSPGTGGPDDDVPGVDWD